MFKYLILVSFIFCGASVIAQTQYPQPVVATHDDSVKRNILVDFVKLRELQAVNHVRIAVDSTSIKAKHRRDSLNAELKILQRIEHKTVIVITQ